ncbi:MAG: sigma-54-dependent Fis family transcriptional regulator [Planctomycetes bacterium]|nr:sigma-54-dependent Fis family transcriptional regulator [Planctomycetota bacterium]
MDIRFPTPAPRILVVDDEQMIRWSLRAGFEDAGAIVEEAANLAEARRRLDEEWPDLLLLDQRLPDGLGMDLLSEVLEKDGELPVLMITAYGSFDAAVDAIQAGAQDYVGKPFDLDEILAKAARILDRSRLRRIEEMQRRDPSSVGLIAESPSFVDVIRLLKRIGRSEASTVLITGDSGVGKGLAARLLHSFGGEKTRPFISVPCTAIPESLLESELFGHEKGAFTDAKTAKPGLAELAYGGTLFLDEIGDLPPGVQAKMLTLLEDRTFRRVGGTRQLRLEARVIAATNRDLQADVSIGRFRADLFYRLRVLPVVIPALKNRLEDIRPLAEHFLDVYRKEFGSPATGFTDAALAAMDAFPWPGNVRELRNAIERAALLVVGERIDLPDLPPELSGMSSRINASGLPALPKHGCSLEDLEKSWVQEALRRCDGNRSQAARLLGMKRDQIRYRIEKFGLDRDSRPAEDES